MGLSEALIASAAAKLISSGGQHLVQEVRAGSVKVRGRRNDVYLSLRRGFPPEGEGAQQYLREFVDVGGYVFDLWMRPFGTWHKKISSRGIILTVDLWVRGPLCSQCHQQEFGYQRRGIFIKREVRCCLNCGAKAPEVRNQSRSAMKLARRAKFLVVRTLKA